MTALNKGPRSDGREIAPAMPSWNFAPLQTDDALAIATYLTTLPAVSHKVVGPIGVDETSNMVAMSILTGSVFALVIVGN